jgi:hypothetical protein
MAFGGYLRVVESREFRSGSESSDGSPHYSSSRGEFKFKDPACVVNIGQMVKKQHRSTVRARGDMIRNMIGYWPKRAVE